MDPALQEILRRKESAKEEIEAIIRLDKPEVNIPGVRIISRFGVIATCRLKQGSITEARALENVLSLKAARLLGPEPEVDIESGSPIINSDNRRPQGVPYTGKNVVIACLDWGLDFANPCFRHADGKTRILALWDQRGKSTDPANKYGYGVIHSQNQINAALQSSNPYERLNYHPADSDTRGTGSHATHVLDIAAGNGLHGGPIGVAPETDLIFVHLADRNTNGLANLGDSVRIMEALDFVANIAAERPWVANLSVGRHGGPHNGSTLCEMAFDYLITAAPNRFIVQSAGNYFNKSIHTQGQFEPGQQITLEFEVSERDSSENELEIWTKDEIRIRLTSPKGIASNWVDLDEYGELLDNDSLLARIYNRKHDPNNGDNHIDIFFKPQAGRWKADLKVTKIVSGNFHAWFERDDGCASCQTRFIESQARGSSTTGTLANGHAPMVIGAFNAHQAEKGVASFSSAGPTRDGRQKPDLVAPGVSILAAQSTPRGSNTFQGRLIRKSGTSMAAPHAAGAVALCLQAAGKPLWWNEIRSLLLEAAGSAHTKERYGAGYLNIEAAIKAAEKIGVSHVLTPANHVFKKLQNNQGMRTANSNQMNPDKIFRMFLFPNSVTSDESPNEFEILAKPGEKLSQNVQTGDFLVRVSIGEPGLGQMFRISSSLMIASNDLLPAMKPESNRPGTYVLVDDNLGRVFARRLLNRFGQLDSMQVLIRCHDTTPLPVINQDNESAINASISEAEPPGLINITHAGAYRIAYDRLAALGVIEPLPGRNNRTFRGTIALQNALNTWAGYVSQVMSPPAYILTGGLFTDKPGEHGTGNAIDVDGFWWSDTNKFLAINAPEDWYRYLTIEATLRKVFGTVLNYDYNVAHHDHWHCDLGGETRWRSVRSQVLFAQRAMNVIWGENLKVDGKWGELSKNAARKIGYDMGNSGNWERFINDIINRQSGKEENPINKTDLDDSGSSEVDITEVKHWADLICFDVPDQVKSQLKARQMSIQYISQANSLSDINLDYYGVKILKLPHFLSGQQMTAPQVLNHIRLHLNTFINTDFANFSPYESQDRQRWESNDPLGAVININIAGPDNAAVVVSQCNDEKWTFTTISTDKTGGHPVSGNREFGLVPIRNEFYIFRTRGADRTTSAPETIAGVFGFGVLNPFFMADGLWRSIQVRVANFVNKYGGKATIYPAQQNLLGWGQTEFYLKHILKAPCKTI